MRQRTLGERAMFVAAVVGIIAGALFLFAPIHGICSSTITVTAAPPGATPGPTPTATAVVCGVESLWQRQTIFPFPFFAVAVWSLAPGLGYIGARMRTAGREGAGTLLMIVGLFLAFTPIVSFGAAYFFVPIVALPTLIGTTLALARSPMG